MLDFHLSLLWPQFEFNLLFGSIVEVSSVPIFRKLVAASGMEAEFLSDVFPRAHFLAVDNPLEVLVLSTEDTN